MNNYINKTSMKSSLKSLVTCVILGLTALSVSAQTADNQKAKAKFSLEIDPATFVFKGYSAHIRIQPKSSDHLVYGLGIYAMDMPSCFVDMNDKNADKGWKVRINKALGLFGEYHFTEVNNRFFVGGQLSAQEFLLENDGFSGNETFTNGLIMAYGGYTVKPFSFPVYIKAWGGMGYTFKMAGENMLNNQKYDIAPISIFATVHLGYTF